MRRSVYIAAFLAAALTVLLLQDGGLQKMIVMMHNTDHSPNEPFWSASSSDPVVSSHSKRVVAANVTACSPDGSAVLPGPYADKVCLGGSGPSPAAFGDANRRNPRLPPSKIANVTPPDPQRMAALVMERNMQGLRMACEMSTRHTKAHPHSSLSRGPRSSSSSSRASSRKPKASGSSCSRSSSRASRSSSRASRSSSRASRATTCSIPAPKKRRPRRPRCV